MDFGYDSTFNEVNRLAPGLTDGEKADRRQVWRDEIIKNHPLNIGVAIPELQVTAPEVPLSEPIKCICGETLFPQNHIDWKIDPVAHCLSFSPQENNRQCLKSKACKDYGKSDEGNGRRIIHRFGRDLRYCYHTESWYIWDGSRWKMDEIGLIREIAKNTMIRVSEEVEELELEKRAEHLKFAARCLNKNRIDNAVSMAQSINAVHINDLDKDGFLLNVKNGTLDLKAWEFRPHKQTDLITKVAGVEYVPDADCPVWKSHLTRIFANDQTFISELQEIFGYCLIAGNPEEVILIAHGSGANGKSKTKEAIAYVLGDYAINMDAQTLMVQKNLSGPRSDIARLQGARFITANESEAGNRLAEGKIKELTGADRVTARELYQKEREFTMTGKIMLCTNHKPKVYGQDPAIWRRLWLIPFEVTIPENERDYSLSDKLNAEGSGILNWLLEGFKRYYTRGRLPASTKILEASRAYRSESDILGEFFAGYEITGKESDYISRADLYNSYKLTVDESEKPLPKGRFNTMIQERLGKIPKNIHEKGACWIGIKVKGSGQMEIAS